MKIIKPSVEFYGAVPTDYEGALRFIEVAGRTCYRSEDKITPDSAEAFVRKLISAGHLAMVEHSNFVARTSAISEYARYEIIEVAGKYLNTAFDGKYYYIGGNLTAWTQRCSEYSSKDMQSPLEAVFVPFLAGYKDLFSLPQYTEKECGEYVGDWQICPHDEIPKELHRYSAKFICDRGVSHELVRHRPCSFAQESTRYVNYAGKDMEFIEPDGFEGWKAPETTLFVDCCRVAEDLYIKCLDCDLKPQQARAVLPNALKTEIVVTADAQEWRHIRKLRTAKSSHPDMVRVMNMMPWEEFL